MMKPINPDCIQRILVTRVDRIGDAILSTPVFSALREHFPKAHIAVMVSPQTREIVDGNPYLNEVLVYDKKGTYRSWLSTLRFGLALRKKHFDLAIHLHSTNRVLWVTWLAGIPARLGWARRLAWSLTHPLKEVKREGEKHEAEYNFDLLRLLGIEKPQELKLYFPLKEDDRKKLEAVFPRFLEGSKNEILRFAQNDRGRYFVIHAGASCPSKIWPAERFAAVARQLKEKNGLEVVLVGGEETKAISRKVVLQTGGVVLDLTGELTLGMLAQLFCRAAFLLSNDSGPVHVAAAVGCPVLSIFGRKDPGLSPKRWRPLGPNSHFIRKDVGCEICLAHECPIDFLCLTEITVDEVVKEIEEKILRKTLTSPPLMGGVRGG